MRMKGVLIMLPLLSLTPPASGIVQILGGPSEMVRGRTWETSTYRYYGPRRAALHGPTVVLTPEELCDPSKRSIRIEGKIVISDRSERPCLLGSVYEELSASGAKAFANTVGWDPPGLFAFRHETWNPCEFCDHKMVMVAVSDPERELVALGSSTEIDLFIGPPHNDDYEKGYTSVYWLIFIQVFLPACCFYTSALGLNEAKREISSSGAARVNMSLTRLVICVIDGSANFIGGVVLCLGHPGPTYLLPDRVHVAMQRLFVGGSTFTTFALALFLREEARHMQTRLSRRSIWTQHRKLLSLVFAIGVGFDLLPLMLISVDGANAGTRTTGDVLTYTFLFIIVPVQIIVSVYFLYKVNLILRKKPKKSISNNLLRWLSL